MFYITMIFCAVIGFLFACLIIEAYESQPHVLKTREILKHIRSGHSIKNAIDLFNTSSEKEKIKILACMKSKDLKLYDNFYPQVTANEFGLL